MKKLSLFLFLLACAEPPLSAPVPPVPEKPTVKMEYTDPGQYTLPSDVAIAGFRGSLVQGLRLSVQVADSRGNPLYDAAVKVVSGGASPSPLFQGQTDEQGRLLVEVPAPPEGVGMDAQVQVEKVLYEPAQRAIRPTEVASGVVLVSLELAARPGEVRP